MLFKLPRAKGVLVGNRKLRSICLFIMCVLIFSSLEHTVLEGSDRVKSPVRLEYDILFGVNIISEFQLTQFCLNRTGERMKETIHTVLGHMCHQEYEEATVGGIPIAGKYTGAFVQLSMNLCENHTWISVQFQLSASFHFFFLSSSHQTAIFWRCFPPLCLAISSFHFYLFFIYFLNGKK